MNTQFDDLLARHLNGTLDEEEKRLFAILLKAPENQLYLASKIDKEFFDEVSEDATNEVAGKALFQRILQQIAEEKQQLSSITDDNQGAKLISLPWYKRKAVGWIAAASVILVVLFGTLLSSKKQGEGAVAKNNPNVVEKGMAVLRHEANKTGREKTLYLPDGSTIVLADKSEISYLAPFSNKRDITLIGKAFFKVAKDKTRPFTVISSNLSTTALGTEFTVTAFKNANRIVVRLYEGKVVVKSLESSNKKLNDVYLLPGQEYVYDKRAKAKVGKFVIGKTAEPEQILHAELMQENPSVPQDEGSWYMFNNQSLSSVFDQLSEMYSTKIEYKKSDVQNLYFIGKFDKSDSLELILKQIGTLNNLNVTRTGNAFSISK